MIDTLDDNVEIFKDADTVHGYVKILASKGFPKIATRLTYLSGEASANKSKISGMSAAQFTNFVTTCKSKNLITAYKCKINMTDERTIEATWGDKKLDLQTRIEFTGGELVKFTVLRLNKTGFARTLNAMIPYFSMLKHADALIDSTKTEHMESPNYQSPRLITR